MLDTDNDQQENKTEQSTPPKALPSEDHSNQIVNELTNLAVQMTEAQGKIKKLKGDRKQYSFIALALILADIAIAIFRKYIFGTNDTAYTVVFIIILILALLVGISVLGVQGSISSLQTDTDVLSMRMKIVNIFSGNVQESSGSYFDSLVQINVENLASYYALVKTHTDKSFLVSIIAGIIGFTLIAAGLVVGFTASTNIIAYITSASGILTEFIAAVFFYLHNRNVAQMKGYHDSLLAVQNILLAFKLVEDTRDETEKAKMVSQMLAYLVGKQEQQIGRSQ
jgi:hypothetical protein